MLSKFFHILAIDLIMTKVEVKMSFLLFIVMALCFSSFRGHKMVKRLTEATVAKTGGVGSSIQMKGVES